jgi:hypothetical protein
MIGYIGRRRGGTRTTAIAHTPVDELAAVLELGARSGFGEQSGHPYRATCDCVGCAHKRAHAVEVRDAALAALRQPFIPNGQILRTQDGALYRASHVTGFSLTLERAVPKVKGKAARKAEKHARRLARAQRQAEASR